MRRRELLAAAALLTASLPAAVRASPEREALIARLRGAVLPVGTFSPTDSPRFQFRGSGFVVGDGRHLVTNAHVLPPVLEGNRSMAVLADAGSGSLQPRMMELKSVDRVHDLAVLGLRDGAPLSVRLDLAGQATAREGQDVVLMGYPLAGALGYSLVTHRGMVAARTRMALPAQSSRSLSASSIQALRAESIDILQLDAVAYPGNSGGPLLDQVSGEVIGVINMVLVKGGHESALSAPSGISYAIPVEALRPMLARVLADAAKP